MTRGSAITLVVSWMVALLAVLTLFDPAHAALIGWIATFFALPLYYLGTLIPTWFRGDDVQEDDGADEEVRPTFWSLHTWCDPLLRRALGVGLALAWVLVVVHLQITAQGFDNFAGLALGLGSIPIYFLAAAIATGKLESKRVKHARKGRPASFWKRHPWLNAILGD